MSWIGGFLPKSAVEAGHYGHPVAILPPKRYERHEARTEPHRNRTASKGVSWA
jgi:hypothetical protein